MGLHKRILVYMACLIFAVVSFSSSASAKVYTLKLAGWGSPQHYGTIAAQAWIKDVTARSGGRIKIIEYPGGQLYGPKEMHKAVARGAVEIGAVLQPRILSMVPMLQGIYLPFAFDDMDHAARAYKGESLAIIDKALAKKRMKLIFPIWGGGVQLWSNKTQIRTLSDLKGLKVLGTSAINTRIFTRLGAAPDTSIPLTEQYMALKRGMAEGVFTSIVLGYFQKYHEITPKITKMEITYPTVMIMMNLKTWKSLPGDIQEIMLEEGRKQEKFTLDMTKSWEKNISIGLKEAGATITTIPENERAKIKKIARTVWDEWADKHGKTARRLLELNR